MIRVGRTFVLSLHEISHTKYLIYLSMFVCVIEREREGISSVVHNSLDIEFNKKYSSPSTVSKWLQDGWANRVIVKTTNWANVNTIAHKEDECGAGECQESEVGEEAPGFVQLRRSWRARSPGLLFDINHGRDLYHRGTPTPCADQTYPRRCPRAPVMPGTCGRG